MRKGGGDGDTNLILEKQKVKRDERGSGDIL
jgi:hypothetical protein